MSPRAASNPPCRSQEKATKHSGRYGAVILTVAVVSNALAGVTVKVAHVTTPKRDILTLGFLRDQMYTRAKASDDERNGIVMSGEMA